MRDAKLYVCERCGKEFLAGKRAAYCPTCRKERSREKARERKLEKAAASGRQVYTKTCEVCGKEYRTTAECSWVCSRDCLLSSPKKARKSSKPKGGGLIEGYAEAKRNGYPGSYGDYQTAWYAQQAQSGLYNSAYRASGYTSLGEELRSGEL